MSHRYKVIHCGTGLAGQEALKAILGRPELELVGLLVHSAKNAGLDASYFIGGKKSSVLSTEDVERVVATKADVVCYMLLLPDADLICRLLASGKNVVCTAGLIFPGWSDGGLHKRIEQACAQGESSFYVTGINPGWVNEILPLSLSAMCRDVKRIEIREYADCSQYPAPQILDLMGFGKTEEAALADRSLAMMREFFIQSIAALGEGLGVNIESISESREFVRTAHAFDIKSYRVPANTIAGQRWRWTGSVRGEPRIIKETYWITAFDLGPGWPRTGEMETDAHWEVILEGTPSLRCKFEYRYSFDDPHRKEPYNQGALATALLAVNSLVPVCEARSGLLNSKDLPLPRGRHL
jgi:2,4-diaminopentanoate dehydrogenase